MYHIVIDLETLGNGSNAPIVTLGAVAFRLDVEICRTFYQRVIVENALKYGHVDASTLLWWMKQSEQARVEITDESDRDTLINTLLTFSQWLRDLEPRTFLLWSNPSTFDVVILENAYKSVELNQPWTHRQHRCYRTIMSLFEKSPERKFGTAHHALDDATYQAMCLKKALTVLSETKLWVE